MRWIRQRCNGGWLRSTIIGYSDLSVDGHVFEVKMVCADCLRFNTPE